MLLCINYADEKFRPWQQLQTQTAYLFGADKVREYSPKDIPRDFYEKNKSILDQPRGAGYWLWKPLIIKDALSSVDYGDYVFYVDSGAFYINHAPPLIDAMQKANSDVMCFEIGAWAVEKHWSKRDAFILMDCDSERYTDTPQRCATYIVLKKTPDTITLIDEFLWYAQEPRIITDMPNRLGKDNYDGFKENRHDQTIWSLLTKRKGIEPFRDPSQYGDFSRNSNYSKDIIERSTYPTILCSHRRNMRQRMYTHLAPQLIFVAKNLIPKEFQESLALIVEDYIRLRSSSVLPEYMPDAQEILAAYHELRMPETPFLQEVFSKLPKSLY